MPQHKRHVMRKIGMKDKCYKNSETKAVLVHPALLQRARSEPYREVIRQLISAQYKEKLLTSENNPRVEGLIRFLAMDRVKQRPHIPRCY